MSGGSMESKVWAPSPVRSKQETEQLKQLTTYVKAALAGCAGEHKHHYQNLVEQLRAFAAGNTANAASAEAVYGALSNCISSLSDSTHKDFIAVLLRFHWRSESIQERTWMSYQSFLCSFVTSQPGRLQSCFEHLVREFIPVQNRSSETQESSSSQESIAASVDSADSNFLEMLEKNELAASAQDLPQACAVRLHATIEKLCKLVPTAVPTLMSICKSLAPHVTQSTINHVCYVKHLLRMTEYLAATRNHLLAIVIRKMLYMDVEIKLDQAAESYEEDVFEMEFENGETSFFESHTSVTIDAMADKLDALMTLAFNYLNHRCGFGENVTVADVDRTPNKEALACFSTVQDVFFSSILNTHKCKCTQFLIFYLCSRRLSFMEQFVAKLITMLQSPSTNPYSRQNAVCYLGSFLARCRHVPLAMLQQSLSAMVQWLLEYVERFEKGFDGPDAEIHGLFYLVCQAVMYVICFNADKLLNHATGSNLDSQRKFIAELGFSRVLSSKFNPGAVILPSVTREFSRIGSLFRLYRTPTHPSHDDGEEGFGGGMQRTPMLARTFSCRLNQIESFFPFDPYLLRHSCHFVDPDYQVWVNPDKGAAVHRQLILHAGSSLSSDFSFSEDAILYGDSDSDDTSDQDRDLSEGSLEPSSFQPLGIPKNAFRSGLPPTLTIDAEDDDEEAEWERRRRMAIESDADLMEMTPMSFEEERDLAFHMRKHQV